MNAPHDLRATPQSVEAEQYVLGALMLDNDAIDRMGDLRAEHFYRGDHRAIFAEIIALIAQGGGADVFTVFERLQAMDKAADVGGLAYLNELASNTPSSANMARYAGIVRDRFQKRGLLAVASEIQDSVIVSRDTAEQLIDHAATKIDGLAEKIVKREPRLIAHGLAEHIDTVEKRSHGTERRIPTGYIDLDRRLNGGFRPGWVVILAGRPGMGKTALSLNVSHNVARDHAVLFLSMEMPESELQDRSLASLGHIPLSEVMTPPPEARRENEEFWDRITAATMKIKDLNLYIDDQGGLRLLDVRTKARAVKRKSGLDLIVLDYLQLMEGDGENANVRIQTISRGLKALAKEMGVAILVLSQLNRKVEEGGARLPKLSDLRDSGSIEQDADAVLFVHREEISNPECGSEWHGFAQIRIAKFRHGATGDVGLTYIGEQVRFENRAGTFPTQQSEPPKRKRGFA
jgi:replicative DNA helicase